MMFPKLVTTSHVDPDMRYVRATFHDNNDRVFVHLDTIIGNCVREPYAEEEPQEPQ